MIRIFLAHASEDKEAVADLYQRLKEHGFTPWLDKVDLLPGQNWRTEIPKAIKDSDVFIACLSQQSIQKQGYIQREFRMALQKMGDMPPGKIFVIPVRLDDCKIPELCQEEYGINLRDYQWVDLFEPDGLDRLVRSVDHHFPGPRKDKLSETLIKKIKGRCKAEGFTKSPQVPFARVIQGWIDEFGRGPDLQDRVSRHLTYWIARRDNPSLRHEQVKAMLSGSTEVTGSSDPGAIQATSPSVTNSEISDSARPSENPSYGEVLERLQNLEDKSQAQQTPKYDLRGAQFAGGFAENVLGDQFGGTIKNNSSESLASSTSPNTSRSQDTYMPSRQFSLRERLNRRSVIRYLTLAIGSIGTVVLGRLFFSGSSSTSNSDADKQNLEMVCDTPEPEIVSTEVISLERWSEALSLTAADFKPISFQVITVNKEGETISDEMRDSYAFKEKLDGIGKITLDLVPIEGGSFMMGSCLSEVDNKFAYEGPRHKVTVQPFLMGRYEVTQAQWRAVAALEKVNFEMTPNPSAYQGDNLPVEQVNWLEAMEFCDRLSKFTERSYRLPREAEWEYACRAGTTTRYHFGDTWNLHLANCNNSRAQTIPVTEFPANSFGLHNMHGNVEEWCFDPWRETYADDELPHPNDKVVRGGAWKYPLQHCRSAHRGINSTGQKFSHVGFRVVCSLSEARQ